MNLNSAVPSVPGAFFKFFIIFYLSLVALPSYSQNTTLPVWSWKGGESLLGISPVYGSKGTPATTNTPGAREGAAVWTVAGETWILGGYGNGVDGKGYLNDLWRYNSSNKEWTWVSGNNKVNKNGVYGTQGTSAANNSPGAREDAVIWMDGTGNLWLYGGLGYAETQAGYLDDVWKYETSTKEWTWVSGSKGVNINGTTATPGARRNFTTWVDAMGVLWLFGGEKLTTDNKTAVLNDLWKFDGAAWTLAKGTTTEDQPGIYGIQGTPAASNTPGARRGAAGWLQGTTLWLFGGEMKDKDGKNGLLNDLWKYDISTGNWVWVKGSDKANQLGVYGAQVGTTGTPGGRSEATSWADGTTLWLMGGNGHATTTTAGLLNDLWKYNTSSEEWTWVKGSSALDAQGTYGTEGTASAGNTPGARQDAVAWKDGTSLWLFGGKGKADQLNDIWKYDVTNADWAWMGGNDGINAFAGSYGTVDMAAVGNIPGSREYAASWTDASGNLWVFGGYGRDKENKVGVLNDVWKYEISSKSWAWQKGSDMVGSSGVYGTQGTADIANIPGARSGAVIWLDGTTLWLFGGKGKDKVQNSSEGLLNDLWKYDLVNKEWTWMKGNDTNGASGVYGTRGTAAIANTPGARRGALSWIDADILWLYGGEGKDEGGTEGLLNDLWKFDKTNKEWTYVKGSRTANALGTYGTLNSAAIDNTPGARSGAVGWVNDTKFLLFGGEGLASVGTKGSLNDLWEFDGTNWAWKGGANTTNSVGVYGEKSKHASANIPGARQDAIAIAWKDASGPLSLWLYGGNGGSAGMLNDLWKYDVTNADWAWMGGSNTSNTRGDYGTRDTETATNTPGARKGSVAWTHANGIWFMGGFGLDASGSTGYLNDLWKMSFEQRPTLTAFSNLAATEDTEQEVTFVNLKDAGDENDNGSVVAFQVTSVAKGTLKIGADNITATNFHATTNHTIDATHNAYWSPERNANGMDISMFNVIAIDNFGLESSAPPVVVKANVAEVNDPPVILTETKEVSFAENGTSTVLDINANNGDGGAADTDITYSLSGDDAGQFNISTDGGIITFNTPPSHETPTDVNKDNVYKVSVIADDRGAMNNKTTRDFTITVTNVNEAPAFTSLLAATKPENTPISETVLDINANDGDGGAADNGVNYSLTGGTDQNKFTINSSGILTFKAVPNYEIPDDTGSDRVYNVTVTASDGSNSATQDIAITVTDVNEAPVFTSADQPSVAENTTAVVTLAATDPEGVVVTFSITGGADQGLFTLSGSNLSFKNAPDYETPASTATPASNIYNVIVTVSDDINSATQMLTVTVTSVNEAPMFTTGNSVNFNENGTGTVLDVNANNGDGGAADNGVNYSLTGGADQNKFTINSASGILTFKAVPNYEIPDDTGSDRVYNVTVTATDGSNSATLDIAITVTDVNEAPVFTSTHQPSVAENTTAVVTLAATDPDAGANLTFSITGGADQGLFILSGSNLSFKKAPDYETPTSTATPASNIYNVIVTVSDDINSTTQTLTVTVTSVNEVPMFTTGNSVNFSENGTVTVLDVNANNGDGGTADSDITYSLSSVNNASKFIINTSTGKLTFIKAPDFETPASTTSGNAYRVEVVAIDLAKNSTSQTITVTVTDVDEAPVFTSANEATFAENGAGTVLDVNATDSDAGAAAITYGLSGADQGKFIINSNTGEISFITPPDFEKPGSQAGGNSYTVVATATGGALSATQSISIMVSNVEEAPIFVSDASATFAENSTSTVLNVNANDGDGGSADVGITYSLTGGADISIFSIASTSGNLIFISPPDYEAPKDANKDNIYEVTVTATDAANKSNLQSVTIEVTEVNDKPAFTSSAQADFAENATGTALDVNANDGDAGTTTVTYSLSGTDAAALDIDPAMGIITFKSSPNFEKPSDVDTNNQYKAVVTATDAANIRNTQSITIKVTDVNEAPVFVSANAASFAENATGRVLNVDANNGDGGGADTGIIYSLSGTDGDKFSINTSGLITFSTSPDFESPTDTGGNNIYAIIVTASDNVNNNTQDITITVTDVNEMPSFTSESKVSFAENATTTVLDVNAVNGDGGTADTGMTYSQSGADQSKFSIDQVTGKITFVAPPDFENATDASADNIYNIDVTASDGTHTITQAISITVTNTNDNKPVFTSADRPTINENSKTVVTLTATDGDGGNTRPDFSVSGGADGALFTLINGTALSFSTAPDFEKSGDANKDNVYELQVMASDGNPANNTFQSITVTVSNLNDNSPVFTSTAQISLDENTTDVVTLAATDADNLPTLTFSISGGPDRNLFTLNASALSFTTAPDFEQPADAIGHDNTYRVEVTATDGTNNTVQVINITVNNVNDLDPVFTSASNATLAEGKTFVITLAATDADNTATPSFSIVGEVDKALFRLTNGKDLTLIAAPDFEKPADANADNVYLVEVAATDGSRQTTQRITVTIANVNDNAPGFTSPATAAIEENTTSIPTLAGTDVDGEAVSFSISGGADGALFTLSEAALSLTTAADFERPVDSGRDNIYEVEVTATDGTFRTTQLMKVTITNTNDNAPVITSSSQQAIEENFTEVLTLTASDVDGADNAITFSISGGADRALFAVNNGKLVFITAPDFEKPADAERDNIYKVEVSATDGVATVRQLITVDVLNSEDHSPVFTSSDQATVAENATTVLTLTATDVDGTGASFFVSGGPDKALFLVNEDRKLVFTTAPDFEKPADADGNNIYTVQVSANDGANEVFQTITITVVNLNDTAPVITSPDQAEIAENTTEVMTMTTTDADGPNNGTITFSITGGIDKAKFTLNGANLSFTTAPDFEKPADADKSNSYEVTVTASDGLAKVSRAIVVTITDTDETIVVFTSASQAEVKENTTAVLTLAASSSEGDVITYRISGGADGALFALSGAGLSFIAAPDFEKPADADADNVYIVKVTATNGKKQAEAALQINVTNVEEVGGENPGGEVVSVGVETKISLYPNPVETTLTIKGTYTRAQLTLISPAGEVLHRQSFDGEAILDMSHLSQGIYFIQLQNGTQLQAFKIMKK